MTELRLELNNHETIVPIDRVLVAGFTGRERAAVEEHIAELEALGVPRPSSTPIFYRVSASRVTTASTIESTDSSSGEVEAVLVGHDGHLWVGAGSDHTDRNVETYSVAVSKQLCEKPIARQFWRYEDVASHWDELVLRSWTDEDLLYQEGALSGLLDAESLVSKLVPPLADGTLMFCGTVGAIGGLRPGQQFRYELWDPVRERAIRGRYSIQGLPLVS